MTEHDTPDIRPDRADPSGGPDPAAVDAAVRSVLASPHFRASGQMASVLRLIVDETLAHRPYPLKERTIARRAMGRPTTFDPRTDPAVRVQVTRLRSALDRYYREDGADDPIRILIPRGGYTAVFVDRTRATGSAQRTTIGPTIAVGTLEDLGPDHPRPHLAIGLPEALVGELTTFPGCRVVGPLAGLTSVTTDRSELPSGVDADLLLTGSLRCSGGLARVVLRLVDLPTGRVTWSGTFDHDVDENPFELEQDVARRVGALVADLAVGVAHRAASTTRTLTEDPTVYAAVIEAYAWTSDLDPRRHASAISALERALEREPDNAMVLALLANLGQATSAAWPMRTEPEERLVRLARTAVALEPTNAFAQVTYGMLAMRSGDDVVGRAAIERALALSPHHPTVTFTAGFCLALDGDWNRGVGLIRHSLDLAGGRPGWRQFLPALDAIWTGDHDAALAASAEVDAPGQPFGPFVRALALDGLGRRVEASAELDRLRAVAPEWIDRAPELLPSLRLPVGLVDTLLERMRALTDGPSVAGGPELER